MRRHALRPPRGFERARASRLAATGSSPHALAFALLAALGLLLFGAAKSQDGSVTAQERGPSAAPPARGGTSDPSDVRPIPRWPDGRVNLGAPPGETGVWEGRAPAAIAFNLRDGEIVASQWDLPTNLRIDEVPFKPWARALYDYRRATLGKDDPHTKCKPSGGPRMWHTPYGIDIVDLPELQEILIVGIGGPHSWRLVHMDGRPHPQDPRPTWFGHSVGHWEGDTLVIDTVGFNERFWLTREGIPYTEALHLVERITRTDFYTLRYEATIDDPRTYTETWSGGWNLTWLEGVEMFEYICQENNFDPNHMVGPALD